VKKTTTISIPTTSPLTGGGALRSTRINRRRVRTRGHSFASLAKSDERAEPRRLRGGEPTRTATLRVIDVRQDLVQSE
jgi:hypothetical protein